MAKVISSINDTRISGYSGNLVITNDTNTNYINWSITCILPDETSTISEINLQMTKISKNVIILSPLFNTPTLKANSTQTFIFKGFGTMPNKFTFSGNSNYISLKALINEDNSDVTVKRGNLRKQVRF